MWGSWPFGVTRSFYSEEKSIYGGDSRLSESPNGSIGMVVFLRDVFPVFPGHQDDD